MGVPRKILIRVIGAPLLVAALCALLYWGHRLEKSGQVNLPLTLLLVVVAFTGALEFQTMCRVKGLVLDGHPTRLALVLLLFLVGAEPAVLVKWAPALSWAGAIAVVFVLYILCRMVFGYGTFTPEAAGLSVLCFAYLALTIFLLIPPVPKGTGAFYLLFLLAAGKGSDMAAFVAGKSIGKHPMAPVVSPNKTWEGGIAGGIVGTGAGLAVILLTPLKSVYAGIPVAALLFFCLIVTIAGQVGDLVKSALKRWAGVKDSGRILPEFGGMLDMVDSFLLEGPVACLGTLVLFHFFKGS
jgi:phosphatidate cytidylyltransferase